MCDSSSPITGISASNHLSRKAEISHNSYKSSEVLTQGEYI